MRTKQEPKQAMSDEHKAALAEGREAGRAVRRYLEALEAAKPKRGRKRDIDRLRDRLVEVEAELATGGMSAWEKLHVAQEKLDLTAELSAAQGDGIDLDGLETEFVAHAKAYSERKAITYEAWRAVGVPADVLRRAGVTR